MDLSKSIEMASATHTGMVRAHNEDSIGTEAAIGLAVFAAIVLVVFRAYLGPEMLLDFVIRLCS